MYWFIVYAFIILSASDAHRYSYAINNKSTQKFDRNRKNELTFCFRTKINSFQPKIAGFFGLKLSPFVNLTNLINERTPRGMNGRFRKLAEAGLGRAKVGCGLFWNNECFIRAIIKIFSFGDCRVE